MFPLTAYIRRPAMTPRQRARRSGQALIEAFGMIIILCMLLFGVVQYVLMLTAKEVVQYGADAAARARVVGLNDFMTYKVARVATIPNAGLMTAPRRMPVGNANTWYTARAGDAFRAAVRSSPRSDQYHQVERYNIPLYLGTQHHGQLGGYLDYEDWDTLSSPGYSDNPGVTVGVRLSQDYELRLPFVHRVWSDDDEIRLTGRADLADHSALYLE